MTKNKLSTNSYRIDIVSYTKPFVQIFVLYSSLIITTIVNVHGVPNKKAGVHKVDVLELFMAS